MRVLSAATEAVSIDGEAVTLLGRLRPTHSGFRVSSFLPVPPLAISADRHKFSTYGERGRWSSADRAAVPLAVRFAAVTAAGTASAVRGVTMSTEGTVGIALLEPERDERHEPAEVLVEQGAMEVVTTSSGAVLYILQSLDE